MERMKIRAVLGKEVVGAGGWEIGKVEDAVVDEASWKVTALVVRLHGPVAEEYRMKHLLSRTTVDVAIASVHAVGTHVILSVTKPELRRMVSSLAGQSRWLERPMPAE